MTIAAEFDEALYQEESRPDDVQGVPEVPRSPEARVPPSEGEAGGSGPRRAIGGCKRRLRTRTQKSQELFESSSCFFQTYDNVDE